jgi:hypothetical protein
MARQAKFLFLKGFSDIYTKANKQDCLMRMDTASIKLREAEGTKYADGKLAHNRMKIGIISVDVGLGDRKGPCICSGARGGTLPSLLTETKRNTAR